MPTCQVRCCRRRRRRAGCCCCSARCLHAPILLVGLPTHCAATTPNHPVPPTRPPPIHHLSRAVYDIDPMGGQAFGLPLLLHLAFQQVGAAGVIAFLPRNSDLRQLSATLPAGQPFCEVERAVLNGIFKGVSVYYGSVARDPRLPPPAPPQALPPPAEEQQGGAAAAAVSGAEAPRRHGQGCILQ